MELIWKCESDKAKLSAKRGRKAADLKKVVRWPSYQRMNRGLFCFFLLSDLIRF
jgi:hypothetical protein